MRLQDKVAIITGGGRGIGKETAKLFAHEGAKVAIFDISTEDAQKTCLEIGSEEKETLCLTGDITNRNQLKDAVDTTVEKFGKIDILINNAGIIKDAMVHKMTEEQWDRVIDVDLKGAFNCIQAVIGPMIERGSGCIINTSSVSGIYGNIGQTNYSAAKSGLIGLTRTLAKELGRKGIRVNAVAPGFIITPMTASLPPKVMDIVKERTPLRMFGEPIDVANAYLYLSSDEARYVNGCVLFVDGGLVI